MAVVQIASSLAPYAEGERRIDLDGVTVEDVLRRLGDRYPLLQNAAFDGDGTPRPHITLFLNSKHIIGNSDFEKEVTEDDEIAVISAIAGG
jgi:sulfur-carrier protein